MTHDFLGRVRFLLINDEFHLGEVARRRERRCSATTDRSTVLYDTSVVGGA